MHMGPAARLVADAAALHAVTDAVGRRLTLRRLTALDRLRLFKAVGSELAQNEPYLGMAMLAASVADIDGVPVPVPANEILLEGIVQMLGDAGLAAAATALPLDVVGDGELAGN